MLILPIKGKWFNMILSGDKREEYREIKPYYTTRFKKIFEMYPNSNIPTGLDKQLIGFRNGYGSRMFIGCQDRQGRMGSRTRKGILYATHTRNQRKERLLNAAGDIYGTLPL